MRGIEAMNKTLSILPSVLNNILNIIVVPLVSVMMIYCHCNGDFFVYDSLMGELLKLPNPFTCPHGRPTVIKMSKYEIERKFARK